MRSATILAVLWAGGVATVTDGIEVYVYLPQRETTA